MLIHDFFRKYADTPLSLRFVPISFRDSGDMTLNDVHKRISELEDKMRPLKIEEERLLKIAALVLEREQVAQEKEEKV